MTDVHADFALDWGDEEQMRRAKAVQDDVCSAPQPIHAIAYPGYPPPFVAHVYLRSYTQVFAGTVWRDDRWPTLDEIAAALTEWRGVAFLVAWWQDPTVIPAGPHCVTCTCPAMGRDRDE